MRLLKAGAQPASVSLHYNSRRFKTNYQNFYAQILSTEASRHIYFSQRGL